MSVSCVIPLERGDREQPQLYGKQNCRKSDDMPAVGGAVHTPPKGTASHLATAQPQIPLF
jgi:hypothetical protein